MIRRPGSQPRQATGSGGASAAMRRVGVARGGGADARVDELGEVDVGALERRGVAARERLEAVEQLDEPPLLGQRLARELAALVGGHVGVAGDRRQRRLHARQRRAQLVAGVGGEAARRVERAVAVVGRAAEAREHRVEAPGERAQLRRPARPGPCARGRPRSRCPPSRRAAGAAAAARRRPPATTPARRRAASPRRAARAAGAARTGAPRGRRGSSRPRGATSPPRPGSRSVSAYVR